MTRSPSWRDIVRDEARRAAHAEGLGNDAVGFNYRWEHVQAVVDLALWLAEATGGDREVAEASAWLHDVAKTEPQHAEAGARRARLILEGTDFPADRIDAVVDAIVQHEGLTLDAPLSPLAAAILWDADKLSKLGATGELHMLAAGFSLRASTLETADEQRRWIEEVAQRTADSMNTAPAKAEAARRLSAMRAWNAALLRELSLGHGEV